jgi:CsoR family transcriptional regulator, copper-sensing transcriptional repressor
MMAEKQDLLNRLKTIEGHVRGIQRMVEDDTYCVDILKQTKAIQRALDKFNSIVLERHLAGCVTTAIRGNDPSERERVIHELLQVFETSTRL